MSLFRTLPRLAILTISALALILGAQAAEPALPPDVQQRLEVLKTGFESFVLKSVTIPYEEGVKALNAKVKPALERESATAAKSKDLDTLVRIKADIERTDKGLLLTDADAPPPASLKNIYAAYKLELAKIESAKKATLADAKQRYDKGLVQIQDELTTAQKVEGALQVKQIREGLATASVEVPSTGTAAMPALKEGAYTNSLGMKFVPVEFEGKTLLFSTWATRYEDYAAYAQEVKGLDKNWASSPANTTVDQINWHEAAGFCEWLTKKERKEKLIKSPQLYRLPTGIEWSAGEGVFDEKLRSNWEWCEDVSGKDANGDELRVIRGKGRSGGAHHLGRYKNMGFRIVLEGVSTMTSKAAAQTNTQEGNTKSPEEDKTIRAKGGVTSHITKLNPSEYFTGKVYSDLDAALKVAKTTNKPVWVMAYGEDEEKHRRHWLLHWFMELEETKALVDSNFIQVLVPFSDAAVVNILDHQDNTERVMLLVLSPNGEIAKKLVVNHNGPDALDKTKGIINIVHPMPESANPPKTSK